MKVKFNFIHKYAGIFLLILNVFIYIFRSHHLYQKVQLQKQRKLSEEVRFHETCV